MDAWANCLNQLHINADMAFFGDSLMHRWSLDKLFPNKTVCNLGLGSNTLADMINRSKMVSSVNPDIVFVLGGINSLSDQTFDKSVSEYKALVKELTSSCPAKFCFISVLPISSKQSSELSCNIETIKRFNNSIEQIVIENNGIYINAFDPLSSDNGFISPEYTTDGIHLSEAGYSVLAEAILPFIP